MTEVLDRLRICVERGKADRDSPHPPDLVGEDGAAELGAAALEAGIPPERILSEALVRGMRAVGDRFEAGTAFIPELLLSSRAMRAAMAHLEPRFAAGDARHRGTVVIGTVAGDIHDIGKNVVRMVLEGEGWRVVDLGVDAGTDRFLVALDEHPDARVAMSSLLTTTMAGMGDAIREIRGRHGGVEIYVGGAPVTPEFAEQIGADGTFPEPQSFARHLAGAGR